MALKALHSLFQTQSNLLETCELHVQTSTSSERSSSIYSLCWTCFDVAVSRTASLLCLGLLYYCDVMFVIIITVNSCTEI